MNLELLKKNATFINRNSFDLNHIIFEKKSFYQENGIITEKINESIDKLKEYGIIILKNIIEIDIIEKINSILKKKKKKL